MSAGQAGPKQAGRSAAPRAPGPRRLAGLLALARAALFWERLWPALWPLTGVLGLFLALGLLDFLPWLPGWLHAALLVAFLAAGGLAAARGLTRLGMPGTAQARRRLALDSDLAHRPLATLDDVVVAGPETGTRSSFGSSTAAG